MNYTELKREVEAKINLEDYFFYWYGEEDSQNDSSEDEIVLATSETVGHGLNLCFKFVPSTGKFQVDFLVGFGTEVEITDESFSYIRNTYLSPIIESSYNLPFGSSEFIAKSDQRASYKHKILHTEGVRTDTYFYSKGDFDDYMTKQENTMLFNPFLAHPPVSLASTNYWTVSERSEFYTSFSASLFSIIRIKGKGRGRNRSFFFFKLNYFPDPKAAKTINELKATTGLKDSVFTKLPEDMPLDVFGAITSCHVEDLIPFDEWQKQNS